LFAFGSAGNLCQARGREKGIRGRSSFSVRLIWQMGPSVLSDHMSSKSGGSEYSSSFSFQKEGGVTTTVVERARGEAVVRRRFGNGSGTAAGRAE
jgi:hypothetical protein